MPGWQIPLGYRIKPEEEMLSSLGADWRRDPAIWRNNAFMTIGVVLMCSPSDPAFHWGRVAHNSSSLINQSITMSSIVHPLPPETQAPSIGARVPWSAASVVLAGWGAMGAIGVVHTPVAPWILLMGTPVIAAIGFAVERLIHLSPPAATVAPVAAVAQIVTKRADFATPIPRTAQAPLVGSKPEPLVLAPAAAAAAIEISQPQAEYAAASVLFTFEHLSTLSSMLKHAVMTHLDTNQVPPMNDNDPALMAPAGSYRVIREGPRYDIRMM